jgi:hypothetical protein
MIDLLYIIQQGPSKAREDPMYRSPKSNKVEKRLEERAKNIKRPCTPSPMPKKGISKERD